MLGPVVVIEARVVLAGAVPFAIAAARRQLPPLRRWRSLLVLGGVSAALPFTLIAVATLVLTAGLAYAAGGVYAASRFVGTPPLATATGQQLAAAALLLPVVVASPRPTEMPSASVAAAVLALAVASTALGFLLFYRLVARIGPTASLTVTYLVPLFGVTWGWLLLDETVKPMSILAGAMILFSVTLVTGRFTVFRQRSSASDASTLGSEPA